VSRISFACILALLTTFLQPVLAGWATSADSTDKVSDSQSGSSKVAVKPSPTAAKTAPLDKNHQLAEVPNPDHTFQVKQAPPEPVLDHQKNKTLSMSPIKLGALIQIAAMRPLRLDATYDQPLSLVEALDYAMANSLPIRIARESVIYQEAQFASQIADFLPSFGISQTYTKSFVEPSTHSSSRVFVPRLSFPVFTGGNDVYSALAQWYRMKGWHETYKSNVNDALLDVYQRYANLVLNHALLKIRVKAVEVSELQLKLNNSQYRAGNGTVFAIMQSRSQLAADKQALLSQQIATRQSSLLLGYALDLPLAANLVPDREYITETSIINEKIAIDELLNVAITHRPELRQYEYFQYSAARNVQFAASNLYPTASFSTTFNRSVTEANTGATPVASASGTTVAGAGIFGGVFDTLQNGFGVGWSLPNMGLNSVANIVGAKALSRQALLQANQQFLLVSQQVRADYITALSAREQIDNAAYGVESSAEALRLAELRLKSGYGTNLELIQAQRDYINALYSQAQAIVTSNLSQAQLLHDMGVISIDALTEGFHLP
jgi:outer membrane protein